MIDGFGAHSEISLNAKINEHPVQPKKKSIFGQATV